ncbi:MAG: hypothetical protein MI923_26360 [Phycisphaerales bacterium]|nr:hypothetical protein [Phycisphaerales bacterium]
MIRVVLSSPESEDPVEVLLERTNEENRDSYHVQLNDRRTEVDIESLPDGSGRIRHHGHISRYYSIARDDTIQVWINGRTYSLRTIDRTAKRASDIGGGPSASALTAPMPGTILKINVGAGDSFEAHQSLIVMESMKMEMTLSAPKAGRIKEISCEVGELVEMGKVLAKLEEQKDAGTA